MTLCDSFELFLQVMEYSHWDYNTDDDDIYTDDEEADEAASDDNMDLESI